MRLCAIFDMDGTLADTRLVTGPALASAAKMMGLTPPSPEAVAAAIGVSGDDFYRAVFPGAPEDILPRIAKTTFALEKDIAARLGPALLFDGVADALDELLSAGVSLALASTGETEHVQSILSRSGLIGHFPLIYCDSNDKTAMVRTIIGKNPSWRYVMIGDKPKDSGAARSCGIPSIGAGYGFSTPLELSGFDAIAAHAKDIPNLADAFATPPSSPATMS